MAVVTITISDDGDDDISIKLESDPAIPVDRSENTLAQLYGLIALTAMAESGEVHSTKVNGQEII